MVDGRCVWEMWDVDESSGRYMGDVCGRCRWYVGGRWNVGGIWEI